MFRQLHRLPSAASLRRLSSVPPVPRVPPPSFPTGGGPKRFRNSFSSGPRNPASYRLWMAVVGGGGTLYYVSHRDRAPITGRARMIDMPRRQEHALGEEAFNQLTAGGANVVPGQHPDAARVRRVGVRLARAAKDAHPELVRDFDWRFALLDAPGDANAVCCPGGKIAVFSGLLDVARDDDALAAVLAHEIGHALARHSAERISFSRILFAVQVVLSVVVDFAGITRLLSNLLIDLPYSRKLELEADHIGLELMAHACYDPTASPRMFANLEEYSKGVAGKQSKGKEIAVSFFSTHPMFAERITKLNSLLPDVLSSYRTRCVHNHDSMSSWQHAHGHRM